MRFDRPKSTRAAGPLLAKIAINQQVNNGLPVEPIPEVVATLGEPIEIPDRMVRALPQAEESCRRRVLRREEWGVDVVLDLDPPVEGLFRLGVAVRVGVSSAPGVNRRPCFPWGAGRT
jgi:hypothetical protein